MREITTPELRDIQLRALSWFQDFCEGHGFRFQLAYGTLLGAVRHRGYIPWDDDIDIMMPRSDYEAFCLAFEKEKRASWTLGSPSTRENWPLPFAKLWDARTLVLEKTEVPVHAGAGIDIWPIDGVPDHAVARRAYFLMANVARLMEILATVRPRADHPWHYALALRTLGRPLRVLGIPRIARLRNFIARVDFKESTLSGVLVGSYLWAVPREAISDSRMAPFEGLLAPIAADHDAILRSNYGANYMTPPPLEQQQTHHAFTAYWTDR